MTTSGLWRSNSFQAEPSAPEAGIFPEDNLDTSLENAGAAAGRKTGTRGHSSQL